MILYERIILSGRAAALFLLVTAFLGLTKLNFKVHKVTGAITVVLAILHFGLIAYKNNKLKHR